MLRSETLQTSVSHTISELESIQDDWAALWSRDSNATPFQSPQWLIPWAQCFGANRLLSIVVFREEAFAAAHFPSHPVLGVLGLRAGKSP